jgi:hypothetical protein
MVMMKRLAYAAMFAAVCGVVSAQSGKSAHVMFNPAQAKWGDPPPVFEKGASFTVVSGNPARPGRSWCA